MEKMLVELREKKINVFKTYKAAGQDNMPEDLL